MQLTTFVTIMQVLRLYCNYAGGSFYCSYVGFKKTLWSVCYGWGYGKAEWVTIFIVFIQVGVSVAIMQVVLSAVHNCFYCKMQVTVSVMAMQVTLSSNNFIFLSLTPTFLKIDRKTFKGIISCLHITTFVNILSKLRYFKGRNYLQIC